MENLDLNVVSCFGKSYFTQILQFIMTSKNAAYMLEAGRGTSVRQEKFSS